MFMKMRIVLVGIAFFLVVAGALYAKQKWEQCWSCGGTGKASCSTCYGSGTVTRTVMNGDRSIVETCSDCNGSGRGGTCDVCGGARGYYVDDEYEVPLWN
jgi:DnaJ-class molecular chaperone